MATIGPTGRPGVSDDRRLIDRPEATPRPYALCSPEVVCWTSDQWVAGSKPLGGMFHI